MSLKHESFLHTAEELLKQEQAPLLSEDQKSSPTDQPPVLNADAIKDGLPNENWPPTKRASRRNQIVIFIISFSLGLSAFPQMSFSFFFKNDLNLDPAALSLFNSIITYVFLTKPLCGFICDSYPLFGSRRRSYLILFSLIQILCWFALSLWVTTLWEVILVRISINMCNNFINVIGEAILVENSQG